MKHVTIYQGSNKIELHNSILGKETIKVNDDIVSSKYSAFGAEHNFNIAESGRQHDCKLTTSLGPGGVQIDLSIDGNPLIVSTKNKWTRFMLVFFLTISIIVLINFISKVR